MREFSRKSSVSKLRTTQKQTNNQFIYLWPSRHCFIIAHRLNSIYVTTIFSVLKYRFCPTHLCAQGYNRTTTFQRNTVFFLFFPPIVRAIHATRTKTAWQMSGKFCQNKSYTLNFFLYPRYFLRWLVPLERLSKTWPLILTYGKLT